MNSNYHALGTQGSKTNNNDNHHWLGFTLSNSNVSASASAGEEKSMLMLGDFLGVSSGSSNDDVSQQQLQQKMCAGDGDDCEDRDDGKHQQTVLVKKTAESFGQRTSVFRGVTRHRWTGRYEAHLWDNSCRREGKSRKGRQVYLGGYDKEDKAARAYDLAALKYWGPATATNYTICNYTRELEEMKQMTRQEFVASLRRRSSGFSRGASIYRGVTRHHQHGRWQARIGRVAGNKDLYLGTFSTQEEAAEAYDIAAIKFRGLNAVTNFDMSRYDVKSIANSNLPIGGIGNKPKTSSDNDHDISESSVCFTTHQQPQSINSNLGFALPIKPDPGSGYWSPIIGGYGNNQITLATPSPNSYSLNGNHFHLNNSTATRSHYSSNMHIYSPSGSEAVRVGTGTMVPYDDVTPISMTMTNSINAIGTHECVSSNGNGISNWTAKNQQEYQSGKSSLSMFQTPIFGTE